MEAFIELFLDQEKLQLILQNIANYVIYIYPGIISIYWNSFLEAKSTKDTQALIIKSFSISFLYNIALNSIFAKLNIDFLVYNLVLIAISLICPYIYNKFKYSVLLKKVCEILRIRTCLSSVPFELLKTSEEKYTCLKIYLTDNVTIYIGYIGTYEYEENKERYVILVGYKKYILKNNKEELVINNRAEQSDQKVFIKYSEIKIIEKIAEDIATNTIYCNK